MHTPVLLSGQRTSIPQWTSQRRILHPLCSTSRNNQSHCSWDAVRPAASVSSSEAKCHVDPKSTGFVHYEHKRCAIPCKESGRELISGECVDWFGKRWKKLWLLAWKIYNFLWIMKHFFKVLKCFLAYQSVRPDNSYGCGRFQSWGVYVKNIL